MSTLSWPDDKIEALTVLLCEKYWDRRRKKTIVATGTNLLTFTLQIIHLEQLPKLGSGKSGVARAKILCHKISLA